MNINDSDDLKYTTLKSLGLNISKKNVKTVVEIIFSMAKQAFNQEINENFILSDLISETKSKDILKTYLKYFRIVGHYGYNCIEISTSSFLSPYKLNEQFLKDNMEEIKVNCAEYIETKSPKNITLLKAGMAMLLTEVKRMRESSDIGSNFVNDREIGLAPFCKYLDSSFFFHYNCYLVNNIKIKKSLGLYLDLVESGYYTLEKRIEIYSEFLRFAKVKYANYSIIGYGFTHQEYLRDIIVNSNMKTYFIFLEARLFNSSEEEIDYIFSRVI